MRAMAAARWRSSSSSTAGGGAASASPSPANNTGAIAFWHQVLEAFAPYTEAPLVRADGLARIEQRFVVS
jgi:hypothetical protein